MKISTKGRYALRLMTDLAIHKDDGYISIKTVSQRQNISEKYLEQIISPLSKAGLVKSIRGAQGGYILTRPAAEITAGDILRAAEGTIAPVECCESGCDRSDGCVTFGLYKKIQDAVDSVVDSVTLADMLADAGISVL